MKSLGKVSHYYGKAKVAIVELQEELQTGDRIRIKKGDHFFDQEVISMQKDYKSVERASKGDSVGIQVDEKTHEGAEVSLLEDTE